MVSCSLIERGKRGWAAAVFITWGLLTLLLKRDQCQNNKFSSPAFSLDISPSLFITNCQSIKRNSLCALFHHSYALILSNGLVFSVIFLQLCSQSLRLAFAIVSCCQWPPSVFSTRAEIRNKCGDIQLLGFPSKAKFSSNEKLHFIDSLHLLRRAILKGVSIATTPMMR